MDNLWIVPNTETDTDSFFLKTEMNMVGLASDGYQKMLGTIRSFIRISVRRDQFF